MGPSATATAQCANSTGAGTDVMRRHAPSVWTAPGRTPPVDGAPADGEPATSPRDPAAFSAAGLNVRWATTAVSLVLAGTGLRQPAVLGTAAVAGAAAVVLGIALHRTRKPLMEVRSGRSRAALAVEVALIIAAIAASGGWSSPFVVVMAGLLVVTGFVGGFRPPLRLAGAAALAVTAIDVLLHDGGLRSWSADDRLTLSIQWAAIWLLTGVIAGYAKRISGEATERHTAALDRVTQLSDANTLLFNLHRLAQTLPASLDQTEVLQSSLLKLRGLLDLDRVVFLLIEDVDRTWTVASRQSMDLDGTVDPTTFPEPARQAISMIDVVRADDLGTGPTGFHLDSRSGLYAPLVARDRLIGLVVAESRQPAAYDERDEQTMRAFIQPVALAIDNARWFGRLRRVSVDEERARLARELHDRIGQSLACLGLDTDRLLRLHGDGRDIRPDLERLRNGVRATTGEIRDALYDLRTDVTEHRDLDQTLREFAARVADRSGVSVTVDCRAETRLPLLQEREMWRIAQESVINAERHADARSITVRWNCDERAAVLDVEDDGRGMSAGRVDSYGIIGMRERADSIGANLEIVSKPGEGTTVRCYLNQT